MKIGDIVEHNKFGVGLILSISSFGDYVVLFHRDLNTKDPRVVLKSSITLCQENEDTIMMKELLHNALIKKKEPVSSITPVQKKVIQQPNSAYSANIKSHSSSYTNADKDSVVGKRIIVNDPPKKAEVIRKFRPEKKIIQSDFEYIDVDIPQTKFTIPKEDTYNQSSFESIDLGEDFSIDMNKRIEVIPFNYKESNLITKEQRRVVKTISKFVDRTRFVLNANYKDSTYNYLITDKTLYFFLCFEVDSIDTVVAMKPAIENLLLIIRNAIIERLKFFQKLKKDDSVFFQVVGYAMFPNLEYTTNAASVVRNQVKFVFKNLEYFDFKEMRKEILDFQSPRTDKDIDDSAKSLIFSVLSPEFIVAISNKVLTASALETLKHEDIVGNEKDFKTFELESEQIKTVNDIKNGHSLILANAGAGKSVVLLSKSIKLSSLNPSKKFLVTCYNSNLADSYKFKREFAGIANGNLQVSTFHAFILKYLRDNYHVSYSYDNIDSAVQYLFERAKKGQIINRFKGIFIDEVQIFEPAWIDVCYLLLEEPKSESIFLLCGDINQDVRHKSSRGKASWQQAQTIPVPKFKGRVRYLKKNYRNTVEISRFLNNYIKKVDDNLNSFNYQKDDEYERITLGESNRNGIPVNVVNTTRIDETKHIVSIIKKYAKENNGNYNDICLIFPFKRFGPLNYYYLDWVRDILNEEGIQFQLIIKDGDGYADRVYDTNGVVITTIDSALGLDFKVVIICGLLPLNYYIKSADTKNKAVFTKMPSYSDLKKAKANIDYVEFYKNTSYKLYTACSRARDQLHIVNTIEIGNIIGEDLNSTIWSKK